ncbi:crossover junction endodeoxyribonuclease RuvC [Candidatus Saccharibacteria bacterium RIFCSPHIGHO2_12_FULL_49_19]|nr:MAG: crossover junction endodeoxyribonuclease RuvC [Candidatus Saccharibacteria bacterium RIFCSPLOWO2_01_FULL_49_22]OGL37475.1 MAG: crossover junction endodeoxyribonuclease RuvC [Candidatus Saccharibacteria bacterium RIFCSPHIGHO2_12_FULL_49_19]
MRIIGIDPGTGILGFGVIDAAKGGKVKLVDGGVIRTKVNQPLDERLIEIYRHLASIISKTRPTVMSIEKLFFAQNVTTAMSVSHARGVAMLTGKIAGLEVAEYTPLQIKQALTGYGRADKKQMQEMVKVLLGLKSVPKPDDCADALACAITHSMSVRVK